MKHPKCTPVCAITVANSGESDFTLRDGVLQDGRAGADAGILSCVDAQAHSVKYTGDGPSRVILVEFKKR